VPQFSISGPTKINKKRDFWSENKPSGNPGHGCVREKNLFKLDTIDKTTIRLFCNGNYRTANNPLFQFFLKYF
jgi:hypothetical protein